MLVFVEIASMNCTATTTTALKYTPSLICSCKHKCTYRHDDGSFKLRNMARVLPLVDVTNRSAAPRSQSARVAPATVASMRDPRPLIFERFSSDEDESNCDADNPSCSSINVTVQDKSHNDSLNPYYTQNMMDNLTNYLRVLNINDESLQPTPSTTSDYRRLGHEHQYDSNRDSDLEYTYRDSSSNELVSFRIQSPTENTHEHEQGTSWAPFEWRNVASLQEFWCQLDPHAAASQTAVLMMKQRNHRNLRHLFAKLNRMLFNRMLSDIAVRWCSSLSEYVLSLYKNLI